MASFAAGDIDVLVATTVIEVGVDVPNATVMVVMDADWFGISQLHQLRGRIGRGAHPSLCLLVTELAPDSKAGQRLSAVASTLDGFELADLDLQQRREGDVLGRDQSGKSLGLRLLSVLEHRDIIEAARLLVDEIVAAAVPPAERRKAKNPARRTFQAIRIAVNSELDALNEGLDAIFDCLAPGGRLCVITFHSLEDRLVKNKFRRWAQRCTCPPEQPICTCGGVAKAKLITRKPIEADAAELETNRRSRSAKLRVLEKA